MNKAVTQQIADSAISLLESAGFRVENWQIEVACEMKEVPAGVEPTGRKNWLFRLTTVPEK